MLATQNVGNYVEKLTGITDDLLAREGIPFDKILLMLKNMLALIFQKLNL